MGLLDLVFPGECEGCGVRGPVGCSRCLATLSGAASLRWPTPAPSGLPPPWSVTAYSGPARELLLAYKERGSVGLRAALAVPLAAAIQAAAQAAALPVTRGMLVVPVPSARSAVRARGDDVVLELTRRAASIVRRDGVGVRVVPLLCHGRAVADSSGLGAVARAANLAGAFAVRRDGGRAVSGRIVVIADDLITTGASISEAARALQAVGAVVIGAATVAATCRRSDIGPWVREATGLRSETVSDP